jgi:superoxide dismutase
MMTRRKVLKTAALSAFVCMAAPARSILNAQSAPVPTGPFTLPPLGYAFDALEPHIDGGGEPSGELAQAIDKRFNSFAAFKEQLTKAAVGQFGSGWSWLVLKNKELAIEPSANQDSPVSHGAIPLLGVDVWEHAYYLKYQNRRADYVGAWFKVINWDFVSERFSKSREA